MMETKTWVRVAQCGDIPLREGRAVKAGNRELAIFNLGNRFLAIENRCPHKGGPLADGIVSGAAVVCPLHAWKLSLDTGKGLTGPSESACVETFRTRVEQGVVFLEISAGVTKAEKTSEGLPVLCVEHSLLNAASESSPAT
ncbi:MAG TPA: nitrite reductase small subunit NirD [Candidatus Sulfotelmatobacter sp.]